MCHVLLLPFVSMLPTSPAASSRGKDKPDFILTLVVQLGFCSASETKRKHTTRGKMNEKWSPPAQETSQEEKPVRPFLRTPPFPSLFVFQPPPLFSLSPLSLLLTLLVFAACWHGYSWNPMHSATFLWDQLTPGCFVCLCVCYCMCGRVLVHMRGAESDFSKTSWAVYWIVFSFTVIVLSQAPSSLLEALEQHLASLEGKKTKELNADTR